MLIEQMDMVIQKWSGQPEITEKEIYAFLHRIKGTAGTIGLEDLSRISGSLLESLSAEGVKLWQPEEWAFYLSPLIDQLIMEKGLIAEWQEENDLFARKAPSGRQQTSISDTDTDGRIILIIDSSLEFSSKLKEELENEGYVVLIAIAMDKGVEMFYRTRPGFVICDFRMAFDMGEESLLSFVSVLRMNMTPIVFTGFDSGVQYEIESYEIGASGYFVKPLDMKLFKVYMRNRFTWQKDIERITTIDELTGALNRKHMNRTLDQQMDSYKREGRTFTLVMLDVDHFKSVNDTYGHLTGDQVLKGLVSVCTSLTREQDKIFRFGGEEFVISLSETGEAEAFRLVEQMREAFAAEVFTAEEQGVEFQCTFSAGIAATESPDESKDDLLEKADQALYKSKACGRNQVTLHNQLEQQNNLRTLHLVIVDDDEFVRTILEKGFSTWKSHEYMEVQVHAYADGEEFLNSGWYSPKDQYIILLDGMMPKLDGIEVLTKIRDDYPDKNIVVSMLSARSDEHNIVQALEKGADDYLFKPFNVLEVIARMDRLAQRMLL